MKPSEEEEGDVPLHTKTIPNEVVRKEISKWVPSMLSEYESLIRGERCRGTVPRGDVGAVEEGRPGV